MKTPFPLGLALVALTVLWNAASAGTYNDVLSIGDKAPAWVDLPGVDGKKHSLADLRDKELVVVVFTCNSCPVAVDYEERITEFAKKHCGPGQKVGLAAISCGTLSEDRLPKMVERAKERDFNFPYLHDASQKIGKAYGALYTPEFFLLDKQRKVVYMGAMDDRSNPNDAKVNYLELAVKAALEGTKVETAETNARGCRIRYAVVRD